MGRKIFISYKYADTNVKKITDDIFHTDTVRDYVDELQNYIENISDHIFKAESDGEDLSDLEEDTIWEKLKDRIYDSTLTIILISAGMRENGADKDQWIPWEISYSLKETSRKNINSDPVTSKSNALLAIVVPDYYGSYNYYTYNKNCCASGCRVLKTETLFDIMRENMFNIKVPNKDKCIDGSIVYHGESSYIKSVRWDDFIDDPETYIDIAYDIQSKIEDYDITKEV